VLEFLVFACVGKLFIFLWQQFPLSSYLSSKWKPLQKLFECDLCFGVWVFSFLALFIPEANPLILIVDDWLLTPILASVVYVFIAFIYGASTSFLVHIFSIGWNAKFQTIVIE